MIRKPLDNLLIKNVKVVGEPHLEVFLKPAGFYLSFPRFPMLLLIGVRIFLHASDAGRRWQRRHVVR